MRPFIESISSNSKSWVLCYPNAGLPNALGGYDDSPESMSAVIKEYAKGWIGQHCWRLAFSSVSFLCLTMLESRVVGMKTSASKTYNNTREIIPVLL